MDEGYNALPSSYLLGSVPAVIVDDKRVIAGESPIANLRTYPPGNVGFQATGSSPGAYLPGNVGFQAPGSSSEAYPPRNVGYQSPGSLPEQNEQATSTWRGIFSISSYSPYFNVDTDVVVDRIMSSVNAFGGIFSAKIDANPDLYGPVWISTTLIFMLSALGNFASYLMLKKTAQGPTWIFDVNYVNWAACVIYGYLVILPTGFYFLLQYFGTSTSLVRLWCMWGYSLFIFIPCSLLLVIPVELVRWIIIILVGASSSSFIATNMKTFVPGDDLMVVVVSAFLFQFALSFFIKLLFFA